MHVYEFKIPVKTYSQMAEIKEGSGGKFHVLVYGVRRLDAPTVTSLRDKWQIPLGAQSRYGTSVTISAVVQKMVRTTAG